MNSISDHDPPSSDERLRRWRLILGGEEADGTCVKLRGSRPGNRPGAECSL